jgi:hypothetical protein
MRRNVFMDKLNPDKFSQRLQDMNRYFDFIPMKKYRNIKNPKCIWKVISR